MDFQQFTCLGGVTMVAETRVSEKGDVTYTRFGMSVTTRKERVSFFATVFGEYGKKLAPHLTKGQQIFLQGRLAVGENNQFSVIADTIVLIGSPDKTSTSQSKDESSIIEEQPL
jgi:single-stranded DNA-binding protein